MCDDLELNQPVVRLGVMMIRQIQRRETHGHYPLWLNLRARPQGSHGPCDPEFVPPIFAAGRWVSHSPQNAELPDINCDFSHMFTYCIEKKLLLQI